MQRTDSQVISDHEKNAWPISVGRITFKERRGPVSDTRRKRAIRTFVKLMQIAELRAAAKGAK